MSFLCNITTKTVSLMLAVFASLPSSADENMQLGFYEGNSVTFIQVKEGATGGSALYFPATTMQAYAGCEITDINVSFFNRSDETEVKVFITTSLDAEPLYQQDVKGVSRGWNKITLDTPFEIDGSAVYSVTLCDGNRRKSAAQQRQHRAHNVARLHVDGRAAGCQRRVQQPRT